MLVRKVRVGDRVRVGACCASVVFGERSTPRIVVEAPASADVCIADIKLSIEPIADPLGERTCAKMLVDAPRSIKIEHQQAEASRC